MLEVNGEGGGRARSSCLLCVFSMSSQLCCHGSGSLIPPGRRKSPLVQGQAARNGRSWIRTQGLGSPRPHFAQASGLVINSVGPLHPHGSHLSLSSWVSLCCHCGRVPWWGTQLGRSPVPAVCALRGHFSLLSQSHL